jgi:hypothetical protein
LIFGYVRLPVFFFLISCVSALTFVHLRSCCWVFKSSEALQLSDS